MDFKRLHLFVMVKRHEVWIILGHVHGVLAELHKIDSVLDDT